MSRNVVFWRGFMACLALLVLSNIDMLYVCVKGIIGQHNPEPYNLDQVETQLDKPIVRGMLSLYNDYAGEIDFNKNKGKKLLFGFSSDVDMVVNAVDLLKYMKCRGEYPETFHTALASTKQICETILYFFTRGLGSEIFVENSNEFKALISIAKKVMKKEDLGGNSAQMALRAFKEGSDVYLHSMMSQHYYKELFNSSIQIVPEFFLQEQINDIHLVIDFNEGQEYESLTCQRDNRLYLQSDKDNYHFPGLDQLTQEILLIKPSVFAIGGFQLMNQRPIQETSVIIKSLSEKLKYLKTNNDGIKFHFEMGAFTDAELLEQILENLFLKMNSFGMNEQELIILMNYFETGTIKTEDVDHERMTTNGLLKSLIRFIDIMLLASKGNFGRIHFHSANFQTICSNGNWKDQKFSLIRSIIVGLKQAMTKENNNSIDGRFLDLDDHLSPLTITLPSISFQSQEISYHGLDVNTMKLDDLIICWKLTQEMQCCIAPTLIHSAPERTCGLGDNIAVTSLLYQI